MLHNAVVHHWAIIFPDIIGPVGILKEFHAVGTVVHYPDIGRAFVGVQVKPMFRIVHVGWLANVMHPVFRYQRSRLSAQGVNPCHVVHMLGIMIDIVALHQVVFHTHHIAVLS